MNERCLIPEVTVYAGPMASGKTKELYSLIGEFKATHEGFVVYKPSLDIREKGIQPRGLSSVDAYRKVEVVESLAEINAAALVCNGIRTILLDEFHMFGYKPNRDPMPDVYIQTMKDWGEAGIEKVHAAGLDIAASGRHFSMYLDAHRYGAKIVLFSAKCEYPNCPNSNEPTCRKDAHNSQIYSRSLDKAYRMESLPDLLPEGDDPDRAYRAVCAGHLLLSKVATVNFEYDFEECLV